MLRSSNGKKDACRVRQPSALWNIQDFRPRLSHLNGRNCPRVSLILPQPVSKSRVVVELQDFRCPSSALGSCQKDQATCLCLHFCNVACSFPPYVPLGELLDLRNPLSIFRLSCCLPSLCLFLHPSFLSSCTPSSCSPQLTKGIIISCSFLPTPKPKDFVQSLIITLLSSNRTVPTCNDVQPQRHGCCCRLGFHSHNHCCCCDKAQHSAVGRDSR